MMSSLCKSFHLIKINHTSYPPNEKKQLIKSKEYRQNHI